MKKNRVRIPFRLIEAIEHMEGYDIVTRDGRRVTFRNYFPDNPESMRVSCYIEDDGDIVMYSEDGCYGSEPDENDLFMLVDWRGTEDEESSR